MFIIWFLTSQFAFRMAGESRQFDRQQGRTIHIDQHPRHLWFRGLPRKFFNFLSALVTKTNDKLTLV